MLQACTVYKGADRKRFASHPRVSIILGQYLKQTVKSILQSLNATFPSWWIILCVTMGWGMRHTHTHPNCKVIK